MFRFALHGAISTRRRRGKEWIYIAARVNRQREEGVGKTRVVRDKYARVLGYSGNYL